MTGIRIGDYEVVRLIARGGFACVYEVRDATGARWALKQLHEDKRKVPWILKSFEKEAEMLISTRIPGVVQGHEVLKEDGAFVMEFVDGPSLEAVIREGLRAFPTEVRLWVGVRLCEAVARIHLSEQLHLDMKPSNVILSPEGRIYLTDFGVAAAYAVAPDAAGPVVGAINYMSAEQLRKEESLDVRADIFSLGVVLYELISGVKPYQIEKASSLRHALEQVRPLDSMGIPGLPVGVALAVQRAISFSREGRWQSTAELRNLIRRELPKRNEREIVSLIAGAVNNAESILEISQAAANLIRGSRPPVAPPRQPEAAPAVGEPAPRPKRWMLPALAGALAVLGLGVAGLFLLGDRGAGGGGSILRPTRASVAVSSPAPPPPSPTAMPTPAIFVPASQVTPVPPPLPVATPSATRTPVPGTLKLLCFPSALLQSVRRIDRADRTDYVSRAGNNGRCPCTIPDLPPGRYRISAARSTDQKVFSADFEVRSGAEVSRTWSLQEPGPGSPPGV